MPDPPLKPVVAGAAEEAVVVRAAAQVVVRRRRRPARRSRARRPGRRRPPARRCGRAGACRAMRSGPGVPATLASPGCTATAAGAVPGSDTVPRRRARSGLTSETPARTRLGDVDAHAVRRPGRYARAAARAQAPDPARANLDERGGLAAGRRPHGQHLAVGREGQRRRPSPGPSRSARAGASRPGRDAVQPPARRRDPRAAGPVDCDTACARHPDTAQQPARGDVDQGDAPARPARPRPAGRTRRARAGPAAPRSATRRATCSDPGPSTSNERPADATTRPPAVATPADWRAERPGCQHGAAARRRGGGAARCGRRQRRRHAGHDREVQGGDRVARRDVGPPAVGRDGHGPRRARQRDAGHHGVRRHVEQQRLGGAGGHDGDAGASRRRGGQREGQGEQQEARRCGGARL